MVTRCYGWVSSLNISNFVLKKVFLLFHSATPNMDVTSILGQVILALNGKSNIKYISTSKWSHLHAFCAKINTFDNHLWVHATVLKMHTLKILHFLYYAHCKWCENRDSKLFFSSNGKWYFSIDIFRIAGKDC